MLLPGGHRVVLEVDGMQHYATGTAADPSVYAKTTRGDRELKLAHYGVFRFGADDMQDKALAHGMLQGFFADMSRSSRDAHLMATAPSTRSAYAT